MIVSESDMLIYLLIYLFLAVSGYQAHASSHFQVRVVDGFGSPVSGATLTTTIDGVSTKYHASEAGEVGLSLPLGSHIVHIDAIGFSRRSLPLVSMTDSIAPVDILVGLELGRITDPTPFPLQITLDTDLKVASNSSVIVINPYTLHRVSGRFLRSRQTTIWTDSGGSVVFIVVSGGKIFETFHAEISRDVTGAILGRDGVRLLYAPNNTPEGEPVAARIK